MAITLTVTINSQELIDEFVAFNNEMNAREGASLTPVQRAKRMLLATVQQRMLDRYSGTQFSSATATAEAAVATETARVAGLT